MKTLSSKFLFLSITLLSLVLVLGTLSVISISGVMRATHATAVEYTAMDHAEAAQAQVAWLRDSLNGVDAITYRKVEFFVPIQKEIAEVINSLKSAASVDDGDSAAQLELAQAASDHLAQAIQQTAGQDSNGAKQAAAELEQLHQSLQAVIKLVPASTRHHASAAADRLRTRLTWTIILLIIVLLASALIHWRQYRILVRPLQWLRNDMRISAANEFRDEIRSQGDREFREVATYFNGLARELAQLYRTLEDKVIARSRELVRSERLASVGFLAAGVAHEINNPLSVIAGYAELGAKSLRRIMLGPDQEPAEDEQAAEAEAEELAGALEAQTIIRDEAFRCKEITNRLLSLARGGSDSREELALDEMARQVTVLTRGLRNYRDRKVVLEFKQAEPLEIFANATEMKQVLLNLTVNALEAVPTGRGVVKIGGRRSGQWVELFIEDNGKGMTPETLQHVFEPFFTAKRGAGEPGTGLGLSITHAIIENHGGRIRAESAGPGKGSRFTLQLPATTHARTAVAAGAH